MQRGPARSRPSAVEDSAGPSGFPQGLLTRSGGIVSPTKVMQMATNAHRSPYLEKAEESLDGANGEFVNGRFNNCANRCYYACFQAAIAALEEAGVQSRGASGQWGHDFVQAEFVGTLINRRKRYPVGLRETLFRNLSLPHEADYGTSAATATQASRALRRAREFLEAIDPREGVK